MIWKGLLVLAFKSGVGPWINERAQDESQKERAARYDWRNRYGLIESQVAYSRLTPSSIIDRTDLVSYLYLPG